MDFWAQDNLSVKLLVEFLAQNHPSPGLTHEQWNDLEKSFGSRIYPDILFLLTQLEFQAEEARVHWYKILEHQEELTRALGRNVGLRVALCDYFTNVSPKMKNPVFVEVQILLQKERTALIDELTGLYNRRFFNSILKREVEHAKRFEQPFSLLVLDVDRFKSYNDLLGHQAGDRLLAELAGLLKQTARTIDYVVRYGGEEFCVLLPQSDKQKALMAAERHRAAVEQHEFAGQANMPDGNVTVTIGVATFPTDAQDGLELFQRADEALYRGKNTGRNVVAPWASEKRLHPRHPINVEMMYRLRASEGVDYDRGDTRDISMGGALCRIDQAVDLDRPLEIMIQTPDNGAPLSLKGKSVRVVSQPEKSPGYFLGIAFDFESHDEQNALSRLIQDYIGGVH